MRRLTLREVIALSVIAAQVRHEVDPTLADLINEVAEGRESALVPAVDRLLELGRDDQAERLKKIAAGTTPRKRARTR